MAKSTTNTELNGILLEPVGETIEALQKDPELAKSQFQITNQWIAGGKSSTTVSSFISGGEEVRHSQDFSIHADEPPALGGTDTSPNPVEHLLNALAGCVTTTLVAHAAIRGIEIEKIESSLEGDLDLNGFLGLNPDTPKGYQGIRMDIKVKTAEENLEKLRGFVEYSPVYSTLTNGTPVEVKIQSE
jgi:uncharacterized OsmC-like protein